MPLEEKREGLRRDVVDGLHVDVHHPPPGVVVGGDDPVVADHSGVVDQHVQAAQLGLRSADGRLVFLGLGVIAGDRDTHPVGRVDHVRQGREAVLPASGDGYRRPVPGETHGDGAPEARARAGDQNPLVVESHGVELISSEVFDPRVSQALAWVGEPAPLLGAAAVSTFWWISVWVGKAMSRPWSPKRSRICRLMSVWVSRMSASFLIQ